jgi:hypothetical protein
MHFVCRLILFAASLLLLLFIVSLLMSDLHDFVNDDIIEYERCLEPDALHRARNCHFIA